MPIVEGRIERLVAHASGVDITLNGEVLRVVIESDDSMRQREGKRAASTLLVRAFFAGQTAWVLHGDGVIASVMLMPHCEIAVHEIAYHGALFTVTGSGIPADVPPLEGLVEPYVPRAGTVCRLELATDALVPMAEVPVDFSRPTFAIVAALPPISTTFTKVRLVGPSVTSAWVDVTVSAGPIPALQVVQPGAAKPDPFTVVFIGNRRVDTAGANASDPILDDRARYGRSVAMTLWGLWGCRSDVFSAGSRDAEWRVVSLFDPSLGGGNANTLVYQQGTSYFPYQQRAYDFAVARGQSPDITVVLQAVGGRDGAFATVDDASGGGTPFSLDTASYVHLARATLAGSFQMYAPAPGETLELIAQTTTALHEMLHAMSSTTAGHITDLYVEAPLGYPLTINKRFHGASEPVPDLFATYNGVAYRAQPFRYLLPDGTPAPYENNAYHAEGLRPTRMNVMDGGFTPGAYPDRLTDAFVRDRMDAKLDR